MSPSKARKTVAPKSLERAGERRTKVQLTHLDARGQARMVEISEKPVSARTAVARAELRMQPETMRVLKSGRAAKGDVLAVARRHSHRWLAPWSRRSTHPRRLCASRAWARERPEVAGHRARAALGLALRRAGEPAALPFCELWMGTWRALTHRWRRSFGTHAFSDGHLV